MFAKGDVTTEDILVECKTVTKPQKSVSIQRDWLLKNQEEAFSRGKPLSTLAFDFGDNGTRYYILTESDFVALLGPWRREVAAGG